MRVLELAGLCPSVLPVRSGQMREIGRAGLYPSAQMRVGRVGFYPSALFARIRKVGSAGPYPSVRIARTQATRLALFVQSAQLALSVQLLKVPLSPVSRRLAPLQSGSTGKAAAGRMPESEPRPSWLLKQNLRIGESANHGTANWS